MENTWVRLNLAGYTPERGKVAIVLSEKDIAGAEWCLNKGDEVVLSGKLPAATEGDDLHVAQKHYKIDFSAVDKIGAYSLEVSGAAAQTVHIKDDPYSIFLTQALGHLHTMRSGCKTPLNDASHLGDSEATVLVPDGDREHGAWKEASPRRTVDMVGGHYDAGDYIKFTLTEANLVWYLLTAYELKPDIAAIADEAKHGLGHLVKTFPDENTFVIQAGDGKDHHEGWRLPTEDKLDGKRPALCALSRTHMGMTAAALALGARLFKNAEYESKAIAIYDRARRDDTILTAFERDNTNDFYRDPTDVDNMALAAAELYFLTKVPRFLEDAKAYAPPPGDCISWRTMNGFANYRLAQAGDEAAKARLLEEVTRYKNKNVWELPGDNYYWGTLPLWMGMANLCLLTQNLTGDKSLATPFYGTLDYTLGRNNWGLGMIASDDLHSVRNIYSFIRNVLDRLPTGAISAGPGKKSTHDSLRKHFKMEDDDPLERFNTSAAVFYDNSYDFMIQETTIWGMGNAILMLALGT
ncbi:MAG: glycoside hydrolase family 9 protein [Defluviitaleaceae bacterium]|nr:glycoside hydrolase family 9 protein [Defluviitaleaceae bacterium]